jgi:hypothetical protein
MYPKQVNVDSKNLKTNALMTAALSPKKDIKVPTQ